MSIRNKENLNRQEQGAEYLIKQWF